MIQNKDAINAFTRHSIKNAALLTENFTMAFHPETTSLITFTKVITLAPPDFVKDLFQN